MTTLTPQQLYQYATQAGFNGQAADEAVAIALAESGGDTNHINVNGPSVTNGINVPSGTKDRGVLQINDWWNNGAPGHGPMVSDAQAFDPLKSFQWAYHVTNGGNPGLFKAYWVTVQNGAYQQYMKPYDQMYGSNTGTTSTSSQPQTSTQPQTGTQSSSSSSSSSVTPSQPVVGGSSVPMTGSGSYTPAGYSSYIGYPAMPYNPNPGSLFTNAPSSAQSSTPSFIPIMMIVVAAVVIIFLIIRHNSQEQEMGGYGEYNTNDQPYSE